MKAQPQAVWVEIKIHVKDLLTWKKNTITFKAFLN